MRTDRPLLAVLLKSGASLSSAEVARSADGLADLLSTVPAEKQAPLLSFAGQALDSLGAASGVFHIELKPAHPSPEIIECNGRLGGFIARLVRWVWLAADNHHELRSRLIEVAQFLTERFVFSDDTGHQVRNHAWLDLIVNGTGGDHVRA